MNLPRFNPRLFAVIGIIVVGSMIVLALVLFILMRGRVTDVPVPGSGGVGVLPGSGEGQGGQIRAGDDGTLPGSGGGGSGTDGQRGGIGGLIDPDSVISDVANGGNTSVQALVQGFPMAASVNVTGGINYYDTDDAKFYTVGPDGTKQLLSSEEFPGVDDVVWSPSADSGILTYRDGRNVFYDFTKNKMSILPRGLVDPVFREDGETIAYKLETGNQSDNWIVVSAVDGQGAKPVQPMGENGDRVEMMWSADQKIIATFRQPKGIDREEIFFIGLEGENFLSMEVQGSGFRGVWSPDGKYMLYHTVMAQDNYLPHLWVSSAGGSAQYDFGVTTWVDKCAFQKGTSVAYCAVPESLTEGAGLAPEAARGLRYQILKVDVTARRTERVAVPIDLNFGVLKDIDRIQVKPGGGELYLMTRETIYSIKLR